MKKYDEGTILRDVDGVAWLVGGTVINFPNVETEADLPLGKIREGDFELLTELSMYEDPSVTKRVDALREIEANYKPMQKEGQA